MPEFIGRQILVADKGGASLGVITAFNITSARSRAIMTPGQMAFEIPASHPDTSLISPDGDNLVQVVSDNGDVWQGEMGREEGTGGRVTVNCSDVFVLLTGANLKWKEAPVKGDPSPELEIPDNTPASTVYQKVIDKINEQKSAHGEVTWTVEGAASNTFKGDLPDTGDGMSYLQIIAERTQTEFAWKANSGDFNPVLMIADKFNEGGGLTASDGPGGNIVESPLVGSDPSARVSGIKLTGQSTNITALVPSWAAWAVHEITPEVTVYGSSTGRFKFDEQVQVDWSLNKATQKHLAALTVAKLWQMYYTYLYAWHDIYGMPFDEHWQYEGPPADLEPTLTADAWHTRQQMGLYHGTTPAHIVMDSPKHGGFLAVVYFRSSGNKIVGFLDANETYTYPYPTGSVPSGTVIAIYTVSGGVVTGSTTWTSDGSDLILGPATTVGGVTLRQIISGSPFNGSYVNTSGTDWTITDATPGPGIVLGGLIGKIWPFERDRVINWDPRRDGVGKKLNRETVFNGQKTTAARWHFSPWGSGAGWSTVLAQGVGPNDEVILVEDPDGAPDPPFGIVVGGESNDEGMGVTATNGAAFDVTRGTAPGGDTTLTADANIGDTTISVASAPDSTLVAGRAVNIGSTSYIVQSVSGGTVTLKAPITAFVASGSAVQFTTARLTHEAGEPVTLAGGAVFDGFIFDYDWPEGLAYANAYIAKWGRPRIILSIRVSNKNGWAVGYGGPCATTITTEWPFSGTTRILGWAPDEEAGEMEVVVEV